MTASDLYSIVKDVEHVWGGVVRYIPHAGGKWLASNGLPTDNIRHESQQVNSFASAALIRDCLARWGHERGMYVGLTHQGNFFIGHVAYVCDERGEVHENHLAALVAMVKEGE